MYFDESEWLMLSSLAYVIPEGKFDGRGNPLPNQTISVSDLLPYMREQATNGGFSDGKFVNEDDKRNYLEAITRLENKLTEGDFIVSKCINHNGSSESGLVVFSIEPRENDNNEVVVCCRGSDGIAIENLNDWVGGDLALAWDTQTTQQKELDAFLSDFDEYDNIYLTGHSLGGNLAMYGAVSFAERGEKYEKKIAGVYSFDGPGFNSEFLSQHVKVIQKINDRIINIQNEHDIVSSSLSSIGKVVIIASSIEGANVLDNHNRWALATNADGSLRRSESGKKDNACDLWHSASSGVSNAGYFLPWLANKWFFGGKGNRCRDFRRETMDRILSAARETENEPWWRIDRWDCWYRVQDTFGMLEWDAYTGNVDTYYRKLIDINDASTKDMERIFEKVYSIDEQYSGKIRSRVEDEEELASQIMMISDSIKVG